MSVQKRIKETFDSFIHKDYENALFQLCCTIEPTAELEYGKGGKATYKQFIHDNLLLITRIATGGLSIANLNLAYSHPELPVNADGLASIQDIFYHVVRCGMYHEGKIPRDMVFDEPSVIQIADGMLRLPAALIIGIAIAVITSPPYIDCSVEIGSTLQMRSIPIPIDKLWGKRKELIASLDAVSALKL